MTLVGSCGSIPSVVSWIIILFLVVSCHFVLGLPALLKSALTLDPFSFIEIFFIGSSSLPLSMCAYSVICFLISLCESLCISLSFLSSFSFAIRSNLHMLIFLSCYIHILI